jgi:hypothetical protein
LVQAELLKDHGWLCTAVVLWNPVVRAAGWSISTPAACRDLSGSRSDQAIMNALREGLPRTLPVLDRRLNQALTCELPRDLKRRARKLAIDWHLSPYDGEPQRSRNELYYGKP